VRPEKKWPNFGFGGGGGGGGGGCCGGGGGGAYVLFLTEIFATYRHVCCGPSAGLNELNCIMTQHV